MEHFFHPLIVWLHLHPTWAGLVTFLITFFESLAIVGLFIPGSVTLPAIGGLIGSGVVPAPEIFAWAILGAILGDGISFWIGYRYHKVIRNVWPIKKFPKLIIKGEQFFAKHGGKGIFLGRFVGPMRPVMPLIAGMLHVSPRKFLMVEFISGLLWAPTYMLPGIIVGAAAAHFAPHQALRYVLILVAILLILWIVFWFSKLLLRKIIQAWQSIIDLKWQTLQTSASKLHQLLNEHEHPTRSRPLSILILTLLFCLLFIILLFSLLLHAQWILALNSSISTLFQSLHNQPITNAAIFISIFLGKYTVLLMTGACLSVYLVIRKDWHALFYLLISLLAAIGCTFVFKHFVHFDRPNVVLVPPPSHSFPSGHTLVSFVFFGYIAFLIGHKNNQYIRRTIYSVAATLIVLVSLSRLYLNFHWFSDILGSLLLAAIILSSIVLFYRCKERANHYQSLFLIAIVLLGQGFFGSAYYYKHAKELRHDSIIKTSVHYINSIKWWRSKTVLLPLYRNNRLGQPSQILNVQWLSNRESIKTSLQHQGWHIAHPLSIKAITAQLMGKNMTIVSPLPPTYMNQKPILIMAKKTSIKNAYLLLYLWHSNYVSSSEQLYIGNVSYHLPLQHWLWKNAKDCKYHFKSPTHILQNSLATWKISNIKIHASKAIKVNPCIQNESEILKIKE